MGITEDDQRLDAAMELYYEKQFSQAADTFREVLTKNPDDEMAKIFFQKIEKLKVSEMPDDWDGIEVMVSK